MRWLGYVFIVAIVIAVGGYAAFSLSPWPSVWLIRHAFSADGERLSDALGKHVPQGVDAMLDQAYGEAGTHRLDVFMPAGTERPLPAIVWIHGGAFIAGDKAEVANYLKILAARGYVTIGVNYTRAPAAEYPTPVKEANAALALVLVNAGRYHIDPTRIFLAGDSAGAQIAAQLAAIISAPDYAAATGIAPAMARQALRGVVLFCGVFDAGAIDPDGPFAGFLRTVTWAYFGRKDMAGDPRLAQFSVRSHLTADYPPAFISAGNGDPLGPQSVALAAAMREKGVVVDELFFPADHAPPLPHEYQFNLDDAAGKESLERLSAFLARQAAAPAVKP